MSPTKVSDSNNAEVIIDLTADDSPPPADPAGAGAGADPGAPPPPSSSVFLPGNHNKNNSLLHSLALERESRARLFHASSFDALQSSQSHPLSHDLSVSEKKHKRPQQSDTAAAAAAFLSSSPLAKKIKPFSATTETTSGKHAFSTNMPAAASGVPRAVITTARTHQLAAKSRLKVLSYNVWFDPNSLPTRMKALGELINQHKPHVICMQEMTLEAYGVFQRSAWWSDYVGSFQALTAGQPYKSYSEELFVLRSAASSDLRFDRVPFPRSIMGREHVTAEFTLKNTTTNVLASTSHLESPTPPRGFHVEERQNQLKQALQTMEQRAAKKSTSVAFFAGDMNWTETRGKANDNGDGAVSFPNNKWSDAWLTCHPNDKGYTYDASTNPALKGYLKGRLDRCFVRLPAEWNVADASLVGREVVPGAMRPFMPRGAGAGTLAEPLPMCISDHYGLLVTLEEK
mmetsp:Transcript_10189/g.25879  ORF Transcript_10189/g.25879 Transcript_10189/m.25879 type:complete len:458 (+) Transcript_10189:34-1407(+)